MFEEANRASRQRLLPSVRRNQRPSVLRQSFATHRLATFRNYAELQMEMGHRSAELLRTSYIAMWKACSVAKTSCRSA